METFSTVSRTLLSSTVPSGGGLCVSGFETGRRGGPVRVRDSGQDVGERTTVNDSPVKMAAVIRNEEGCVGSLPVYRHL